MSNTYTIAHVDTCLPDYFRGHHKPVIAVPVWHGMTRQQLIDSLHNEINDCGLEYAIEHSYNLSVDETNYDAIKEAINDCVLFDNHQPSEQLFLNLDENDDEENNCSDSVYAYFILDIEKE